MGQFYKILKADPLGDAWTPNQPDAKPIQQFWCQVENEEWAVSIGKQVPNVVTPGESVYGDLMKATSQKGTNYWKFKSAQVPEGVQRPATTYTQGAPAQAQLPVDMSGNQPAWFTPWGNMITYIYNEMKKMDADAVAEEPAVSEVPTATPVVGEPLSEETQAILDDIFSKPIEEDK